MAKSLAPIGFTFSIISIATGSLWGKPTWGDWWVWDARLTSMMVLLFLYIFYIFTWKFVKDFDKANKMASVLYDGLSELQKIDFPYSVDANMLFPVFPTELTNALHADGFTFYDNRWGPNICRLVTAFNTEQEDINNFIKATKCHVTRMA